MPVQGACGTALVLKQATWHWQARASVRCQWWTSRAGIPGGDWHWNPPFKLSPRPRSFSKLVSAAMSLPLIALSWAPFPSSRARVWPYRAQCALHLDRLLVQLCHFGRQRADPVVLGDVVRCLPRLIAPLSGLIAQATELLSLVH